jgi:hypothetical protein
MRRLSMFMLATALMIRPSHATTLLSLPITSAIGTTTTTPWKVYGGLGK